MPRTYACACATPHLQVTGRPSLPLRPREGTWPQAPAGPSPWGPRRQQAPGGSRGAPPRSHGAALCLCRRGGWPRPVQTGDQGVGGAQPAHRQADRPVPGGGPVSRGGTGGLSLGRGGLRVLPAAAPARQAASELTSTRFLSLVPWAPLVSWLLGTALAAVNATCTSAGCVFASFTCPGLAPATPPGLAPVVSIRLPPQVRGHLCSGAGLQQLCPAAQPAHERGRRLPGHHPGEWAAAGQPGPGAPTTHPLPVAASGSSQQAAHCPHAFCLGSQCTSPGRGGVVKNRVVTTLCGIRLLGAAPGHGPG